MGMRVSLAFFFFFFCACAGQGEKNPKKTQNVEGRPHFFFGGGLNLEQVQGPAVQKMSRERER